MGKNLFDKFTYLHFGTGLISYYFNINIYILLIIHTIFEYTENTILGMHIINKYMPFWPGGKPSADTIINRIGDTIGVILGWLSSLLVEKLFG